LILSFWQLDYFFNILRNILGIIIFIAFPGFFIGIILFKKFDKFDLIGIIFLTNYFYYTIFGIIYLQFGYIFNNITIYLLIIVGTLIIFISFYLKKLINKKYSNQDIDKTFKGNLSTAKKDFSYLMLLIIFILIISTYIIYYFNYPFIYGDLWEHTSILNSIFNGTIPPTQLTYGFLENTSYHSWMSYIFIALGKLIINLPTYQIIFLLSFFEVIIPIILFNFLLNRLFNNKTENFYKLKKIAIIFFAFFSGFGGIFVIISFFFMPQIYLSQGTNFLKAIGIFTGDIFDPLKIQGYIIQVFAIGILFLGIGFIFQRLRNNRVFLSDLFLFPILCVILMQTHFEIFLIFLFLLFIIFFPLIFYKERIKISIKFIIIFTFILIFLTLLFNYLFSNTTNKHFPELIYPIITYISKFSRGILLITPYLIETSILCIGVISIILILIIKGFKRLNFRINKLNNFFSSQRTKIMVIILVLYVSLFLYWIYQVMDLQINWSSGEVPLYLLPTALGFLLLFSILGIGIKKPFPNLIFVFLNLWAIFLLIIGYSFESFIHSYISLQTRLFSFIIPVLDIFAASYLVNLINNEKIWNKLKLNKKRWRVLFTIVLICLGSLSYIFYTIVQCQRGLDPHSKLTNSEIQSLDWIRENTLQNSCVFSVSEIMSYGIMVIGQRYTTFYEGYTLFDDIITTNCSDCFWYLFNITKISYIIISWARDSPLINNLNESYFKYLITTTKTSIVYFQNGITIYDVNLMKIEFLK